MFKTYRANAKGNVAIMFAVSLFAFIAIIGAAIDTSRLASTNSKLQNLSDSLTLAAAINMQNGDLDEARLDEFARIFLKQNGVPEYQTTWTMNSGVMSFTLSTAKDTVLMGAFGHKEKYVSATASVPVFESRDFTLALVLDTTLSMGGTRMASLKRAANEMIDVIRQSGSDQTYVSVVPFSEMVKIPVTNGDASWFNKPDNKTQNLTTADLDLSKNCRIETTGESRKRVCDEYVYINTPTELSWSGCMISRNFGYHKVPDFSAQRFQGVTRPGYCSNERRLADDRIKLDTRNVMSPMTNNMDTVASTVNAMIPHGGTYIPGGLMWGWRTLQGEAPLTEVTQASAESQKVMIVMTDGANERSLGGPVAWSEGLFHDGDDIDAANTLTAELCEGIKNDDVEIYTIALEVTDADTITMMETCATTPSHFYDVGNSSGLSKVFENISTELADIRLSH